MQPVVVSDILAVGEFPSPDQMEVLARAGFRAVINCQPDGEVARLAASQEIAAAAQKAGLAYAYCPLIGRMPDAAATAAFVGALDLLPAPVFAFCYSGARPAAAAAIARAREEDPDTIIADIGRSGFDVAVLRPWMVDVRREHSGRLRCTSAGGTSVLARPVLPRAHGASGFAM